MNEVNKEFSEAFIDLCKSLWANPRGLAGKIYKCKQNRKLEVVVRSDQVKFIFLYYWVNPIAFYDARDNSLHLNTWGYGSSPSIKELLNNLCPQGYGFFSRNFVAYTLSPSGEKESDGLVIKPYI